jgi:MafB19-like deaminase
MSAKKLLQSIKSGIFVSAVLSTASLVLPTIYASLQAHAISTKVVVRTFLGENRTRSPLNATDVLLAALDTNTLSKFRSKTTLTDSDTVAFVEGVGIDKVFGVNSGAQTRAAQALGEPNTGLELRQSFFERIQNELGELSGKKMNPDAQALLHAEAHSLMRASKRYGTRLPKALTIHVDRKTCTFCSSNSGLPLMMRLLKIDSLTVYSVDRNFKLTRNGNSVTLERLN